MKKFFNRILTFLALTPLTAMQKEKPVRIVFFGDSITEAAVHHNGYIDVLGNMLKRTDKDHDYELIGAGIGGNKVYDLYLRHEEDVLSKEPDVVFIMVGINDVWHKKLAHTGTDPDKFEKFYRALIKRFQDKGIRVILGTPPVIGERTDMNELDEDLNLYADIVRKIGLSLNCDICEIHDAFKRYLTENNPQNKDYGILTTDMVHLNDRGNRLVADCLLPYIIKG